MWPCRWCQIRKKIWFLSYNAWRIWRNSLSEMGFFSFIAVATYTIPPPSLTEVTLKLYKHDIHWILLTLNNYIVYIILTHITISIPKCNYLFSSTAEWKRKASQLHDLANTFELWQSCSEPLVSGIFPCYVQSYLNNFPTIFAHFNNSTLHETYHLFCTGNCLWRSYEFRTWWSYQEKFSFYEYEQTTDRQLQCWVFQCPFRRKLRFRHS